MSNDSPDDVLGALLRRAATGDEAAFAELYDAVAGRLFGLALRVTANRTLAEEVTQEALLQVWREAARFDPARGSGMSWMLTIVHRRAVDRVRSEAAQSKRELVYESRSAPRGYDSTVELTLAREVARTVRTALAELPRPQREAIELAYLSGLTHTEVSERLGVPLGTAKTRIRDGMAKLRRVMGGGEVQP